MSVEILLLRNQLLDYLESDDENESMLGEILHERTHYLDGMLFALTVREILDGLRKSMDQFERDWQVIK